MHIVRMPSWYGFWMKWNISVSYLIFVYGNKHVIFPTYRQGYILKQHFATLHFRQSEEARLT